VSRQDPLDTLELSLRCGAAELHVVRHADAVPESDEAFTIYDDYEAHPLSARGRAQAEAAGERFAEEENVEVTWDRIWSIEPILFDEQLVELADEAIREVCGTSHRLPSGPLHDAAEVARAGVPTVMIFVQSLRGLSHTKLEDTKEEHLELAVQALDRLATKTMEAFA